MFTTAFYGFFRIGELATKNVDSGGDVLQYDVLSLISSNGSISMAKLTIRKFKDNPANKAFEVQIRRLGRWQSDAFKTYLRSGALSANAQND